MGLEINKAEISRWSEAVSTRIIDEWDGSKVFTDDAETLKKLIKKALFQNPIFLKKLIGSGLIEEDYFDDLKCRDTDDLIYL